MTYTFRDMDRGLTRGGAAVGLLLSLLIAAPAGAKEPPRASPPKAFVTMKVREVRAHDSGGFAVILQTSGRKKVLPIWIGRREAQAIQLRLSRARLPRPLTHSLLESALTILGATVVRVEVMDIQDKVFIGKLDLKDAAGKRYRLDGRPSDLITLAVGAGLPIHVAQHVLDQAGIDISGKEPKKLKPKKAKKKKKKKTSL